MYSDDEIEGAGHYGIFSGSKWREKIYPQVRDFILAAEQKKLDTKGSVHRAYQTYIECTPFLTDEEQYTCELEANDSPIEPQIAVSNTVSSVVSSADRNTAPTVAAKPATKTKAAQAGSAAQTAKKALKTATVAAPKAATPKAATPKAATPKAAAPKAAAPKAAAPKTAKKPATSAGKNKAAKPAFPSLPPRAA